MNMEIGAVIAITLWFVFIWGGFALICYLVMKDML